jgi:uncharacterized protein YbjT (DUF2867 family)
VHGHGPHEKRKGMGTMTIAVYGAYGYQGRPVLDALLAREAEVLLVGRRAEALRDARTRRAGRDRRGSALSRHRRRTGLRQGPA